MDLASELVTLESSQDVDLASESVTLESSQVLEKLPGKALATLRTRKDRLQEHSGGITGKFCRPDVVIIVGQKEVMNRQA